MTLLSRLLFALHAEASADDTPDTPVLPVPMCVARFLP